MFVHLPIWIGITAVGPSVLNIIAMVGDKLPIEVIWLLVGSIVISLISIGVFLYSLDVGERIQEIYRKGSYVFFAIGIITILFLFISEYLSAFMLLICLLILLLIPIFFDLIVTARFEEENENINR